MSRFFIAIENTPKVSVVLLPQNLAGKKSSWPILHSICIKCPCWSKIQSQQYTQICHNSLICPWSRIIRTDKVTTLHPTFSLCRLLRLLRISYVKPWHLLWSIKCRFKAFGGWKSYLLVWKSLSLLSSPPLAKSLLAIEMIVTAQFLTVVLMVGVVWKSSERRVDLLCLVYLALTSMTGITFKSWFRYGKYALFVVVWTGTAYIKDQRHNAQLFNIQKKGQ